MKENKKGNRKATGEESSRDGDAPMYLRYLCCTASRQASQNSPKGESPLNNSPRQRFFKSINSQATH